MSKQTVFQVLVCFVMASVFCLTGANRSALAQQTDDAGADGVWPDAIEQQLVLAAANRAELERALESTTDEQRASMEFLVEHMPEPDLKKLSSELLLENVRLAHQARAESAWKISDELFLNDVLPYANVDETRERWRALMYERAKQIIVGCKTPGEAAQRLNQKLFAEIKVKYSTKRKRANQSPSESIEQGLASCTGLSILLVDACRAVNVPSRLAGIPRWSNKQGNHTWVEVWDDGQWHFTGAAEYNAKGLDRAWFQKDAALADKNSKMHSIYAVSYRKTGTLLPMVWSTEPVPVSAVNVTDRYLTSESAAGAGKTRVMIRVVDDSGHRVSAPIAISSTTGEKDTTSSCGGVSRDESADTNDFLTFELDQNATFELTCGEQKVSFTTDDKPQMKVDVKVPGESALTHAAAAVEAGQMFAIRLDEIRQQRKEEWDAKVITLGDLKMKFDYRVFGEAPADGHSLYISMHGGGGAPAEVNEKQWKNQIGLYQPKEGIYLAPRAATDTWNLWHQSHIDKFFARIIEDAVAIEGVNPNRVYLMGYSAGGDGVYQLAPRMADRLAAAAMMAGHPNGVSPLGLRNIGFTLHMGGKDGAFKRNKVAEEWKEKLAELRADDPEGYQHEVVIHPEAGHWMDRKDAVAVDWMAKIVRDPLPKKIVWVQSGVVHEQFYWLAAKPEDQQPNAKMVVIREGNEFTIEQSEGVSAVVIRLNDRLVDFEQPIVVHHGNKRHEFSKVSPSRKLIRESASRRCAESLVFVAEIEIPVQ